MSSSKDGSANVPYTYGPPTETGKIPFTPPGTDLQCETAYWLWGDLKSKTPPLIMVHGGPGAPGRDFKPLTPLHDQHGIPILMYDEIGCGESTHLRELRGDRNFWTLDLFVAELDNLRDRLQISTFDLFGASFGGNITLSYALTQPFGLRKLILASTGPSDALRREALVKYRAELPQDAQDTIRSCEAENRTNTPEYGHAMTLLFSRILCRLDPWPPEMHETMALMQQDDTVFASLCGTSPMDLDAPQASFDVVSRLPEITEKTAPGGVLITNGGYDLAPDSCARPMFNYIRAKVKWVRFAQSAHFPHLEQWEDYFVTLADFLTIN